MENVRHKILVVESDPVALWRIGATLTREGFSVCTSMDGLEAIELLKQRLFDAVVTALRLPGLNGLSLVDWVRENRKETRVIVMTDFDPPPVRKACASKGVSLCLRKPVDLGLLTRVLSRGDQAPAFTGSVNEIDILEYVQLMMLTGRRILLRVRSAEGRTGVLHIDRGTILHAECEGIEGEEAVFRCLSFAGGTFEDLPWTEPVKRTISQSGEFLLIEAARRRDDACTAGSLRWA